MLDFSIILSFFNHCTIKPLITLCAIFENIDPDFEFEVEVGLLGILNFERSYP